jgi:hypothetical protein
MKKIIVLLAIVALAFGTMGATCMQNTQTTVCNAPADVVAQIQAVMTLTETALATFVPGTAPYVAAVGAYATASAIQSGLCIGLTQLNALIAFLQDPKVAPLQAKAMIKAGPMRAVAINPQAFIDWRDKAAK